MRARVAQNILALFILGSALAFGFLPGSDLYPVMVEIYVQGDNVTWSQINSDFQEGTRALDVVVDNRFTASSFPGDLILTPGEHFLVFLYKYQGEVLDRADLTLESSRSAGIRVDLDRTSILKVGLE